MTPAEALALAERLRELPPDALVHAARLTASWQGPVVEVQLSAPLGPTLPGDSVTPSIGAGGPYLIVARDLAPGLVVWWTVPAECWAVTP